MIDANNVLRYLDYQRDTFVNLNPHSSWYHPCDSPAGWNVHQFNILKNMSMRASVKVKKGAGSKPSKTTKTAWRCKSGTTTYPHMTKSETR